MNNDVSSFQNSRVITSAPIEILDSEPLTTDDDVQIVTDCVTVDNDSDVIVEDGPVIIDLDSDDLEIIESDSGPIIIEDENPSHVINPLNVLKKKQDDLFNTVCLENRLLAQLIEEAINLDSSGSMKRIIQRTLIPLYLNLTEAHKESEQFKNNVKRTTMLLETAPHLKYSHIKTLCHSMKFINVQKKKSNILRRNGRLKRKKENTAQTTEQINSKKNIDKTEIGNTKKNNTNSKKNESKRSRKKESKRSKKKESKLVATAPNPTSIATTSNKENVITDNIQTTEVTIQSNSINIFTNTVTNINNNTEIDLNNLLMPHYVVSTTVARDKSQEIESLEKQIALLKENLDFVEQMEVNDDDMSSPYVTTETIKLKIVKCYKRLCEIVGVESTKRHEVKLQVVNGHPTGPARCLEEYINDNIDEYGNPPFPDIFEVVRCVERAVEEDRLRWNRKQIVAEAQVLLKHYGHAIQKRRKKREWRDMVSHCKEEMVDPADLDPALEAKLLENSRIAKRNEDEIIDRYARLEKENISNPAFRLHLETGASDSESEDEENHHNNTHIRNNSSTNNLENLQSCPNLTNSINIQGYSSVTNSKTNLGTSSNDITTKNVLPNKLPSRPDITNSIEAVNSNTQSGLNLIYGKNIVEAIEKGSFNVTDVTTNLHNCPMILVNSSNNLHPPPNLHGKVCFINSTPLLATRIQEGSDLINLTKVFEGNSQNDTPKNIVDNLQNGPNIKNTSKELLSGNLQNGQNFPNSNNLTDDQNNEPSVTNTPSNLQNRPPSFINTYCQFVTQNEYLMTNTVNKMKVTNKKCLKLRRVKLQSLGVLNVPKYTNGKNSANNRESNLQHGLNKIEGNLQSRSGILNASNDAENNLQHGSNNIERNLQNHSSINNASESNTEGNLRNHFDISNASNNLEVSLQGDLNNVDTKPHSGLIKIENKYQSRSSIVNAIDNLEDVSHDGPTSTATDIKTDVTNIGDVEYKRTILMDSYESDTDNDQNENIDTVNDSSTKKERDISVIDKKERQVKIKKQEFDDMMQLLCEPQRTITGFCKTDTNNERKEHVNLVTDSNTMKERDKSDTDEIEYKNKIKQEEDDVIQLLSELNSDCVGTVFDIEDPFLVIEISDSSDEDE